jgi:hypothetical protein
VFRFGEESSRFSFTWLCDVKTINGEIVTLAQVGSGLPQSNDAGMTFAMPR